MINEDQNKHAFKCFYFDVGLLQAALDVPYNKIISDDLSHYKGPIAENFVAQQLFSKRKQDLFSWKDAHHNELEFLYEKEGVLIPIEVKASKKSLPSKSLTEYMDKQKPLFGIKVAPRNFGRAGNILSLPIYFAERIPDFIGLRVSLRAGDNRLISDQITFERPEL